MAERKLLVMGPVMQVVDVRICDSKDASHLAQPRLATRLLHWVTGPIDYCDECASRMLGIAEVLATHVHVEPIDQTAVLQALGLAPRRGMKLERVSV